ncbi:MAG: FAD-dependent oxidoreductase, partial [Candidatus Micrarchaeota archaeon]|nr:FAD-dependent oxidoreductase [Candidatus Micrarchaeota archaeon]
MVMGDLPQETDVLVIGGGPGGYVAALRAASFGKKVMLVEKERLGGMCLHYGCIPSKTLIHVANFLDDAKHAKDMGLDFKVSVDLERLRTWKQSVIDRLTKGIEHLCQKRGVNVVTGTAEFESPGRALIHLADGKQGVEFAKAIIATGSSPVEIPGLPFTHPKIWNARKALAISEIPKRLAVVGAGYIGLELGFCYAKMGSAVTMVEGLPAFLPQGDADARKLLEKNLKAHGMDLLLDAKVNGFAEKDGITLQTSKGDVAADAVLVAVGNRPNTKIGLEKAGVKLDAKGFIATNASMQTNQPNIYAIGDVRGAPLLAHKAFLEGKVAGEHACGQKSA